MPKCWWAGTDKIWRNKGFEASLQSFSSSWTSSTTENCWHSFSQKHWTALQKRKRPDDCWNLHNHRIEDFSRPLSWSGPPWNPASQWLLPLAIAPCTLWFSNTTCYGHPEEKIGEVRRYSRMSKRESTMRQSCGLQVKLNASPQLRKALYNVLLCKAKGIKKQLQGRVVQLGNHDLIHNRNEWINKEDCETLWKANWAQHTVLAWAAPNTNSFLLSANIWKRVKGSLSAPGGFHMVPAYFEHFETCRYFRHLSAPVGAFPCLGSPTGVQQPVGGAEAVPPFWLKSHLSWTGQKLEKKNGKRVANWIKIITSNKEISKL